MRARGGSPPLEWRGRPDGTYGLKTLDAVAGHVGHPREIKPSLREFEALLATENLEPANT